MRSAAIDVERDRLDTQIGWSPEATRVLRKSERAAFETLRQALPGCLILAQVPVSRFAKVPRRNSRTEWMRRLGSQCVDFAVCDQTSRVVGVVEVRRPLAELDARVRQRIERVMRTLETMNIPVHLWEEDALPSVEAARSSLGGLLAQVEASRL